MAVTTGTQGVQASPATTFASTLETAITGVSGWTKTSDSDVAAATAATTGNVRVFKCNNGSVFYVFMEISDANTFLRFRVSEAYDTTTHQLNQPCGGGTATTNDDTTGVTPTANGTVTDTATTNIGSTNPLVSYGELQVPGGGFSYLYEVRSSLLTIGVRASSKNYYIVAGDMTSLVTAVSDSHPILLLTHPANTGLNGRPSSNTPRCNAGCASRTPGIGASSTTGAFHVEAHALHSPRTTTAVDNSADSLTGINFVTGSKYFNNALCSPAIIHGHASGSIGTGRAFRGYLSNFVCAVVGSTTEPAIGDTFTVGGVTYYFLGTCYTNGASGVLVANQSEVLAIKG